MIGWCVFGALVVAGFMFGVVAGYERPRPAVAKTTREPEAVKPEPAKTDTPKPASRPASETTTPQPSSAPKDAPPAKPVVTATPAPKSEPKQTVAMETTPPKPTPPATTPKTDPKPPANVATATPKTETMPKMEDVKSVSFKTEVLPILRRHCLDCHGGGKGKPRGDVDLTTIEKIKKSPSPGKMLVLGKPNESDIYTSITEREMPDGGKPKPSKDELLVLKNWILSGAKE